MKFYYVTNFSDLHTFEIETMTLLKFFKISTEMHLFLYLFFIFIFVFDDNTFQNVPLCIIPI